MRAKTILGMSLAAAFLGASIPAIAQTGKQAEPPLSGALKKGPDDAPPTASPPLAGSSLPQMSEARVRERLEQQGYTNIREMTKSGDGWTAKATKDGKQLAIDVDPNGTVKTPYQQW